MDHPEPSLQPVPGTDEAMQMNSDLLGTPTDGRYETSGVADVKTVRALAFEGRSGRVLSAFTGAFVVFCMALLLGLDSAILLGYFSWAYWTTITPWFLLVVSALWLTVAAVRRRASTLILRAN